MNHQPTPKLSYLDLAPIAEGRSIADGVKQTVAIAKTAEKAGLHRYWLAEHHNMPAVASAATAVLLSHIGTQTSRIRIGSGGVMLPNHSPLVIAEQFGTLQALYGDRIDLGLGRAPGSDGATFRALRRTMHSADGFPQDVQELMGYLYASDASNDVTAYPGMGSRVPVWILGSSLFGANLAAKLGLPYAFASHFAPRMMGDAIAHYRQNFQPSTHCQQPYVMLAANLLLANDADEAHYHFTSAQQSALQLVRGNLGKVPRPVANMDTLWHPQEQAFVEQSQAVSFIGGVDDVRPKLRQFIDTYRPDELIVAANIWEQDMRLASIELTGTLELFALN